MAMRAVGRLIFTALFTASLSPAAIAAPKHVILIMMENHGTDTLFGNRDDAPFLNALIGERGVRYATQYYGVTHPSLPNYLAFVSGDTMGIHDDCRAGADAKCPPEEFVPGAEASDTHARRGTRSSTACHFVLGRSSKPLQAKNPVDIARKGSWPTMGTRS